MKCLLILTLYTCVKSQEVSTPSSELKPRDYNHHARELDDAEPTKQGPVLFPNDAPPPPRPPLIVTSRPLLESIARSELADNMTEASQSQNIVASLRNNLASQTQSFAAQSQDRVSFVPFLARAKDYRPYIPSPSFDYQLLPTRLPYAAVVKKSRLINLQPDNRHYDDYEEQTALPPIYKALSDHAAQKVLKIQKQKPLHYQVKPAAYNHQYQNNDINEENTDYDENKNYAFSYTVKDHKTGDDFSHSQHSSGSATNGEYRVRLPDGRMQIVSYTADENGYKADVRYDDEKNENFVANNHKTVDIYNNQPGDYHNQPSNYHDQPGDYHNQPSNYHDQPSNYHNQRNNYYNHNNYQTPKYSYVTVRPPNSVAPNHFVTPIVNNYINNQNVDYTDRSNKHDYDTNDQKEVTVDKDYYQYPDLSKEYYPDYSSEYNSNNNYQPHKSKFNFVDSKNVELTNKATASTVKPSYEELKDLFVTKNIYNTKQNYDVDNIVPTTPISLDYTTERVVNIGGKTPNLYTNIKHGLNLYNNGPTAVPVYATPKVIETTPPRSYLVSTIASLKNKVSLATKPVLSDDFISRINKYINFNK